MRREENKKLELEKYVNQYLLKVLEEYQAEIGYNNSTLEPQPSTSQAAAWFVCPHDYFHQSFLRCPCSFDFTTGISY